MLLRCSRKKKKGGVSLVTQRNTNMVTISNAISFGLLGSRPFGLQASTGTLLVVGGMGDLLAMVLVESEKLVLPDHYAIIVVSKKKKIDVHMDLDN